MSQQQLHWSQRAMVDPGPAPAIGPSSFSAVPATVQRTPLLRPRSRRTPLVVTLIVCLVVAAGVAALLLINAKNSAAAAKEAKAAAVAQMGLYTDYTNGVSFQVPIAWDQIPLEEALAEASEFGYVPSAVVAFGDAAAMDPASSSGSFMMFAGEQYPAGTAGMPGGMSVKEALDQVARTVKSYAPPGLSISEGVTSFTANGMDGAHLTMEITEGSITSYARICFIDAGTGFYMFMFAADDRSWEHDRYFFEGTLDSFSLVGTY